MARTERKTAPGYHGFVVHAAPDVTLEEDLARRDLTINAIAAKPIQISGGSTFDSKNQQPDLDTLVDPHGGVADLRAGVLRHVTDAFREDPVRILRVARFAARFPHFTVAPETQALMRDMVASGEVDHLVPELMAPAPSRMLQVLRDCGALQVLLPELDRLWGVPQRADYHPEVDTGVHMMMVMDMAARLNAPLAVRFACLCHDLGKGTTPADILPRHLGHEERSAKLLARVCDRWKVPRDCRELADVVAREHGNIHRSGDFSPAALVRLLERCDALRRPERFAEVLLACECDARGRGGLAEQPYPQRPRLLYTLQTATRIDTKAIAASAIPASDDGIIDAKNMGERIAQAIHGARVAAVAAAAPPIPPEPDHGQPAHR